MTKTLIYPLTMMILLLNSCGESKAKRKAGILPEKKMVELLVETHLTDAVLNMDKSRSDAKRDKALFYYPSILEKYQVTKAQMDSSVLWYMRNPSAYARIYQQVIKDLEKRQAAERKKETEE